RCGIAALCRRNEQRRRGHPRGTAERAAGASARARRCRGSAGAGRGGSRGVAVAAAARLGRGVVAAGAMPLSVPAEMQVTQTARYRQMLADYQLLAREQLICGTQVHVGVANRGAAVLVANRVARYLPTLLALSASSPFWPDGSDTGYS